MTYHCSNCHDEAGCPRCPQAEAVENERRAAIAYIRREAAAFPRVAQYTPAIVLESIADMLEEGEHHAQVFAPKVGDYVRVRWAPKGLTRTMGCVVEVTPAGVRVDHGDGEVYGWALGEVRNALRAEAVEVVE